MLSSLCLQSLASHILHHLSEPDRETLLIISLHTSWPLGSFIFLSQLLCKFSPGCHSLHLCSLIVIGKFLSTKGKKGSDYAKRRILCQTSTILLPVPTHSQPCYIEMPKILQHFLQLLFSIPTLYTPSLSSWKKKFCLHSLQAIN